MKNTEDKKVVLVGEEYMDEARERWSERGRSGEWDATFDDPQSYMHADQATEIFVEKLIQLMAAHGRQVKVLDVGCGTGNITPFILPYMEEENLIGIDYAAGMIEKAKQKYPTIDWRVMACQDMPFAAESFDVIFARGVMPSHLGADYWRKSCLEFLKLLRPGGSLFFDYLSAESTIEQPKNKTMFNSEEIMETYRSIGFSNIEILHPEKKNGSVLLTK